jgi:hypothetical protein
MQAKHFVFTTVVRQVGQQRPPKFLSVVMMAKAGKDCIEMDGIVTDALPNAMFRVELEANKQVMFLN